MVNEGKAPSFFSEEPIEGELELQAVNE